MNEKLALFIHFVVTMVKLIRPGGVKALVAENHAMKQQLLVIHRKHKRSPPLTSFDRFLFGFLAFFITKNRLQKVAVILKPSTILNFHKALVKRKYSALYSNQSKKKAGRKPPDQTIIDLVIEMKKRNPMIGYGRIAMQIYHALGIEISRFAVGRILRKNRDKFPSGHGPSWLTFIDSLWSVDLFRCESIHLKSHWVMVVIDQYSRRIIGFAVHAGDCTGVAYCQMFNKILSGKNLPKYLSSDNDALFLFHQWQANLRILGIEEIKSIPRVPQSHPFIERVIGIVRREYLDHTLFFNQRDLDNKLKIFQHYYNNTRVHSSLGLNTPEMRANDEEITQKTKSLDKVSWQSHCNNLYQYPVPA